MTQRFKILQSEKLQSKRKHSSKVETCCKHKTGCKTIHDYGIKTHNTCGKKLQVAKKQQKPTVGYIKGTLRETT